jgi:filamentous hemagglutinin
MNSNYASVTNQAGIYAGNGSFQINVADNTHLTGGILDSTASADTNHLTTGTLTMEDIQNKADYDVKNIGVAYTHYGNIKDKYDNYNKTGLTPNLSAGAKKDASSTTLSAIGQGSITTTKQQMDLSKINRDTRHSLNELGTIFDKKKIEERQELAQLFAKNANELLHSFDKDGKFDKVLAHGIVAEITSQIAGNKAGSGFLAGTVNEALIHRIEQLANGDPAKMQWISAALGATVNAAAGGTVVTGAATAQYGTKWNNLSKTRQEQINLIMKNEILTGKMSGDNVVQFFEGLVAESKAEDKTWILDLT